MKHNSIARKVTSRVFVLLLLALVLLFTGSFFVVRYAVRSQNEALAEAIATVYGDLVVARAEREDAPIDPDHPEAADAIGEYICTWYGVDYAYMYVPDVENGTVYYVSMAASEDVKETRSQGNHYRGELLPYELSPEELAVWNGDAVFAMFITDNSFGHEISTVLAVEDGFGNRLLAGVDNSYRALYVKILHSFLVLAAIVIAVLCGIYFVVYMIMKRKVSAPAQQLSRAMQDYLSGGTDTEVRLPDNGTDEYAMIAASFNQMTGNISRYLDNIGTLTRDREHRQTEIDIAARIQQGILPKGYYRTKNCEIRAMMSPAKDIGGDLYDYVPLDSDRTLLVVADVSGKGVAAAIFMAVTLTLIHQNAKMGLSPAQILKETNEVLCRSNPAMLFATAFVGIYDQTTGIFTYANAGHNPPYLLGKKMRMLSAEGTLIGLFDGEEYEEKAESLALGDTLFLYTDGVTEALSERNGFYGTDRLEAALARYRSVNAEDAVSFVYDAVKDFTGDTEQHDDITMLSFTVTEAEEMDLSFALTEFSKIKEAILSLPLCREDQLGLCLAAEECFVNICSYAFPDGAPEGERIRFTLSVSDRIVMRFEDGGQPFDPLENLKAPDDYDVETQTGGLGDYIAFSTVDDARYEYTDGKNILTLIRHIREDEKSDTEQ